MADVFKTSLSVTYTKATPPETARLIPDMALLQEPEDHEGGQITIQPNTTNQQIGFNVNTMIIYVLETGKKVDITVDNPTNTPMTNMSAFMYSGNKTNVYVSNNSTESVKIAYASCALS